jgi:hypothetical protein
VASNAGTVVVTAIRNPMVSFADAGWKFTYDHETRFVQAEHPLGGKFSVCEVSRMTRTGGGTPITWDEVGEAFAAFLSEKAG